MIAFAKKIHAMNTMYKLPVASQPAVTHDTAVRLEKFKRTLSDEVNEIDDIVEAARGMGAEYVQDIDLAVMIADILGDVVVYCHSEALKYGIPLAEVLDIIMASNESKLGADGLPIYNADGKFLKGPNYWKPEPAIRALLITKGGH
jgi:predicted HAD superfamily Cof-like phosphohydrolase